MDKTKVSYVVLVWLIVIVVILWLTNLFVGIFAFDANVDDGRGTMGDMFGAVNALFAGLAFAGLIFTIRNAAHY